MTRAKGSPFRSPTLMAYGISGASGACVHVWHAWSPGSQRMMSDPGEANKNGSRGHRHGSTRSCHERNKTAIFARISENC